MKIYVGRWNLLPAEWEGINGLYEKSEDEIRAEISRQVDMCCDDYFIAVYTPAEFEDTFNHSAQLELRDVFPNGGSLNGAKYFVKFFDEGKSLHNE